MDNKEQRLFNNFGYSVMEEEVARILQAKEELDYHRQEENGEEEIQFWVTEVNRLSDRLITCLRGYMKNDWEVFLDTFNNRNESNYTKLGYFAKMYKFMFNKTLPFDND